MTLRASPAALLSVLAAVSAAGYGWLAQMRPANGAVPVTLFLAVMAALFALHAWASLIVSKAAGAADGRRLLGVVWIGAILFRLMLLPAGVSPAAAGSLQGRFEALRADVTGSAVTFDRFLLFDNDIWRYVWEGHVWAHGGNPFVTAPAHPALDRMADVDDPMSDGIPVWADIREQVSYSDVPTVYPPLAQATFRLAHAVAPGSVLVMKAIVVAADLLGVWFLALALRRFGRPPALVALYAWNPLAIKVFAGSGHIDAVTILMLCVLLWVMPRWRWLASVSFALAILVKLTPAILLPLVGRRIGWRATMFSLAVVLAGCLPFAGAGGRGLDGIRVYATEWRFNAGPFEAIRWMLAHAGATTDAWARTVCAGIVLSVVAAVAWHDDGRSETFAAAAAITLGVLVMFSPAVMPWYVTPVLPFAVLSGQRLWVVWSALVGLAFLVMVDGIERPYVLMIEYGLLAAAAVRLMPRRALAIAVLAALAVVAVAPSAALAQGSGSLGSGAGAFTVTQSVSGSIAEVTADPRTIVVQDKKDKRHTFRIDDKTTLARDRKGGKDRLEFSDLRDGLPVKVTFRPKEGVATDVRVQREE
ncbi:MAG: glycosyltransferase family 87 protein [Vicinamibacterales bacterium]